MKRFIMMFGMLAISIGMTACGPQGERGRDGADYVPPVADSTQQQIDAMIAQKNADRAILAQAPLTPGLSCVVQQVASGQCLSSSSTAAGCNSGNVVAMTGTAYTYLYKGSFDQASTGGGDPILLLPVTLRGLFAGKNFRISCTGQIVVLESNYYDFSLNSDDGSILSINGGQVVNNDNNHGMTLKVGSALLYRNVQSFSLQYAQTGGGAFGLELRAGGAVIDPRFLYH